MSKSAARPKTQCPVTRQQFREKAPRAISVVINGVTMAAMLKEFETGSFGWYLTGQTVIEVDGTPCKVQVGMPITVVGSKDLPK